MICLGIKDVQFVEIDYFSVNQLDSSFIQGDLNVNSRFIDQMKIVFLNQTYIRKYFVLEAEC